MTYSTPELVVLGPAHVLVLGGPSGKFDHDDSATSKPMAGLILGLDD
jgi:hypothetical protein